MTSGLSPSRPKGKGKAKGHKTPEERNRDRAIKNALAKAGGQSGPFVIRIDKGKATIASGGAPKATGGTKHEKNAPLANQAMAEAMRRASIVHDKAAAPQTSKGDMKIAAPTSFTDATKKPSADNGGSTTDNRIKLKGRKRKATPAAKTVKSPPAPKHEAKRRKRFLARMRKVAQDMQGELTPVELRWQQRQIEIEELIASIKSASFSILATQWKKHVALVGYIEATGTNADRHGIYSGLIAAIEKEWARRGKLAYSSEEYFDWPSTRAANGKRGQIEIDWASEGFLSYLGYHVGESSELSERDRHAILKRVFAMTLPPLESPEYVKSWGSPGSAIRLKKMAQSLASFARSAKRRSASNFATAITEWERDLSMLREEFYVAKFGFAWPTT